MIMSMPMVYLYVAKNATEVPKLLYEVLRDMNGFDYMGQKLNPQTFQGAPFVTSMDMDFQSEKIPELNFTMELPMKAIHRAKKLFVPNNPEFCQYVYVQFGYYPEIMSELIGFTLTALPKITGGFEGSMAIQAFGGVEGFLEGFTRNVATRVQVPFVNEFVFPKSTTIEQLFKWQFGGFDLTISPMSQDLAQIKPLAASTPVATTFSAWFKDILKKANIGSYVTVKSKGKLEVTLMDLSLSGNYKANKELTLVDREFMPADLKFGKSDAIILPILNYSYDSIAISQLAADRKKIDVQVKIDEATRMPEIQDDMLGGGGTRKSYDERLNRVPRVAPTVSGQSYVAVNEKKTIPLDTKVGAFEVKVTTLMYPGIFPYGWNARFLSPSEDLTNRPHLVRGVKYSLVGSYDMELTINGFETC